MVTGGGDGGGSGVDGSKRVHLQWLEVQQGLWSVQYHPDTGWQAAKLGYVASWLAHFQYKSGTILAHSLENPCRKFKQVLYKDCTR